MKKEDPAPSRVKPAPIGLLHHAYHRAIATDSDFDKAVVDLSYIGFFYLCRPGESTEPSKDCRTQPFRLQDAELFVGPRKINPRTATAAELKAVNFVSLIFTKQKNGVDGENVGLGLSSHEFACPVEAVKRRVAHLVANSAADDTPLDTVYSNRKILNVKAQHVTAMLRLSATILFDVYGIDPMSLSARSLRSGGAMAMLSAGIDENIIKMTGRWKSEAMMRYLHLSSFPLRHKIAESMLQFGAFTLLPGDEITAQASNFLIEGDRLRALRLTGAPPIQL
jgi:hypothetical protein